MNKSLRILIVGLTILALAMTASAQAWRGSGRLQGVVIDKSSGKPVDGAKVTLICVPAGKVGPAPITTDKKGKWAVMGLLGGQWFVDVEAPGYLTAQKSLSLSELQRLPPMKTELEPVPPPKTPAAGSEGVQIGGQSISKETVAAIEAGNAMLREEKYKEAIVEYEKARLSAPDLAPITRALSMAYYRSGMVAEAQNLLEGLNSADPTNLGDAYSLASIYFQNSKLDEAKMILDKVPGHAFTDPTVLIEVGKHFYNANRGQDAHDYFSRAVTLDANHAESYYYRALGALLLNKPADAKADFQKVVELAPDSAEAKEAAEMLKSLK